MADSYSPVEASRVLGVSEKRVRQFADDGRLEVVQPRPLRVSQESVHALREQRKEAPPAAGGAAPRRVEADVLGRLETLVAQITEGNRRALETAEASARSTEEALRDVLAQSQARVTELEARLSAKDLEVIALAAAKTAAEARVVDLEADLAEERARRGLFGRRRKLTQETP